MPTFGSTGTTAPGADSIYGAYGISADAAGENISGVNVGVEPYGPNSTLGTTTSGDQLYPGPGNNSFIDRPPTCTATSPDTPAEVKKPLTKRGWDACSPHDSEEVFYSRDCIFALKYEDAKAIQALEDQPALIARIEALEAERRWIPVGERLPEVFGEYIVAIDGGSVTRYFFTPEALHVPMNSAWRGPSWGNGFGEVYSVTHWMPLPSPPDRAQERRSE